MAGMTTGEAQATLDLRFPITGGTDYVAVVIPESCLVRVRFADTPEQFTRDADRITLT